jgi:hypothetical protein
VLHGGHGEGEDETGKPFFGATGSGTLPARVGGNGTVATSSVSGLRTGAIVGTSAGRQRRVSDGVSVETMTAPGGMAHLARHRQATAASARRLDTGPAASDHVPTVALGQQWGGEPRTRRARGARGSFRPRPDRGRRFNGVAHAWRAWLHLGARWAMPPDKRAQPRPQSH